MTRPEVPRIAIVGVACRYPDASTPAELWENVLAQRRAFRRLPAERLRLEDYLSADPNAPDRTYAAEAALIEGYEFDRVQFRVAGATFRTADLTHWLALDVATQALVDAGFPEGDGLPKTATGVLLGNTLTGEFSRANGLRLRWPYVRRTVEAALAERGWPSEQREPFLQDLEAQFKTPFPPIGEESLAGSLSNTIAGRICNHFDFRGGGYTVDGACASSLLAVTTACSALVTGDLDVALAGGVDLSLDPFELVGFAKAGALARDEMRVYDARSAGFWPGEGCSFVLLMREQDAIAQQRRIYALIHGWGVSSDGSGGITRPEADGQLLAVQRAYRRAGFGADTVAYFEGHGTGTAVGDATELRVLTRARREGVGEWGSGGVGACSLTPLHPHSPPFPAAVGSIKANIGHTKAAAGVAGLIKAVMALHTQILPPTTGCQTPHPELCGESPALCVLPQAEPWPVDLPLRAGVSAMGFGGINTHVVLEGNARERRATLDEHASRLAASAQDAELFLFGSANGADLRRQIEQVERLAPTLSWAEMGDLAAELQRQLTTGSLRAAVVATKPSELASRMQTLQAWLAAGTTNQLDVRTGLFLGDGTNAPRIGFLFPGQGTPIYEDGGALARRFLFVREIYDRAGLAQCGGDTATAVAQPAIVTAEVAALRVLDHLDIAAHVAVGHSLGELSALHWAGAFDEETLLRIAQARGRIMAALDSGAPERVPSGRALGRGDMAHIGAHRALVAGLFNGDDRAGAVTIACLNAPTQTIISGEAGAVAEIVSRARAKGWQAGNIPVSHAFHSPLMLPAAEPLAEVLAGEMFHPLQHPVISTVTGDILGAAADLRALLCDQVTAPVRFVEAVSKVAEVDLLVEVGPGRVLSGLVREFVDTPVVAMDAGGSSLRGLLLAAGAAYALGAPFDHAALFAGRFTRPFDLSRRPHFFTNPCELAPVLPTSAGLADEQERADEIQRQGLPENNGDAGDSSDLEVSGDPENRDATSSVSYPQSDIATPSAPAESLGSGAPAGDILALVRQLVAERAELPPDTIRDEDRLLSELHLNSITVSQLVVEAARRLNLPPPVAPTEYANVTVAAVAQTLTEAAQTNMTAPADEARRLAPGVETWVRAFTVELVEHPLSRRQNRAGPGVWTLFAPPEHPLAAALRAAFASAPGQGVLVCLPPQPDECHLSLLLDGVRSLFSLAKGACFVLIQQGGGAAAFARTLHLEEPDYTVCVVDVPPGHAPAARWVLAEAMAATGYSEAHYDAAGGRREPVLQLLSLPAASSPLPLGTGDVLLVTGGGKGITAECALALARASGVRLALLGRSHPATDAELVANLARMDAAGVEFQYLVADVTQAEEVRAAVQTAERMLGPITAILHGAARNVPRLLRSLDEETFRRTLAPKLQGARNLLAAIDPKQLRLFVTFGSTIARTGLPGEADYGLANEWLVELTAQVQREYPACRCLAVEWSVWSGAGMGDRLGRLDALVRQGVTPIALDEGVAMLQRLLAALEHTEAAPLPAAVVVSGRMGKGTTGAPTLRFELPELPFWRFLEEVRVYVPGVELVVDVTLSADTDPYLADHVFQREPLLPAVMGLEAMAQAAMALAGSIEPPVFEDIRFDRPVVVPEQSRRTIRLAALVQAPDQVEVVLRSDETAFQVNHFQATCRFDTRDTGYGVRDTGYGIRDTELPPIKLDPAQDVYGTILFHEGRFRRLKGYRYLAAKACVAEIGEAEEAWFGRYLPADLVFGDPGAHDAVIHALQVCVPQATLLPVGVEWLALSAPRTPGPYLVQAHEQAHEGDIFTYDVDVIGANGQVQERWQGLRLRMVRGAEFVGPWPAPLFGPYLERRLAAVWPDAALRVAVVWGGPDERRTRSDRAIQQALGQMIPVLRRPDGKPEAPNGQSISVAHAGDLTFAVAGAVPVGCDVECVRERPVAVWQELLGPERFSLAETVAREAHEDLVIAATRVWTAGEGLKKAGAAVATPLVLASTSSQDYVLLSAGACCTAVFTAQVRDVHEQLVFAVTLRSHHAHL